MVRVTTHLERRSERGSWAIPWKTDKMAASLAINCISGEVRVESYQHVRLNELPTTTFNVNMPQGQDVSLKYGGRFYFQAFLGRPKAGFFRISNELVWTGARSLSGGDSK